MKVIQIARSGTDGAVSETIPIPGTLRWARLVSVMFNCTDPGESNSLVVTKDSGLGAAFDTVLYTADLNGLTEAKFYGEFNVLMRAKNEQENYSGDAVKIAFPNAADGAWNVEVIFTEGD
jgi:hypothetical protein